MEKREPVLGTMNIEYPYTSLATQHKLSEYKHILTTYMNSCKTPIIDTAYYYGNTKTEQILGTMLTEYSRNEYKIATKANPWTNNDFTNGQFGQLSPNNLCRQLTTSLQNLQLDSVDVFYLHCPDHETPIEHTLEICTDLWRQEKFAELGVSNYSKTQLSDIMEICENTGFIKPRYYQGMYNLVARKVEEIFPLMDEYNMEFWAYNPLAGGLLTGKYNSVGNLQDMSSNNRFKGNQIYQNIFWKDDLLNKLQDFFKLENPTASAFQWLNSKLRTCDKIIMGASSCHQLKSNMLYINKNDLVFDKTYFDSFYNCKDSPNYYY